MTAAIHRDEMLPPDADASIWREVAFVRLWTASTISYVGSSITKTALAEGQRFHRFRNADLDR